MRRKSAFRKNSMQLRTRSGSGIGGGKPRARNPLAEEPFLGPELPLTKGECLTWMRQQRLIPRRDREGLFAGLGRECGYTKWMFQAWINGKWTMSDRAHARVAPVLKRIMDGELAFTRPIPVLFGYDYATGSLLGTCIPSKPYNPKEQAALEPKWPFI